MKAINLIRQYSAIRCFHTSFIITAIQ